MEVLRILKQCCSSKPSFSYSFCFIFQRGMSKQLHFPGLGWLRCPLLLCFHVAVWSLTKGSEETGDGLLLQLENMKMFPLELKILLAAVCSFKKDSDSQQTFRYLSVYLNNPSSPPPSPPKILISITSFGFVCFTLLMRNLGWKDATFISGWH